MNRHLFSRPIAAIASFGFVSWVSAAAPALSQESPHAPDPQQSAIQMLEENPEQVIDMMRSLLDENPGLVQQIQQNPAQAQQIVDQNSALLQYLQQNPELVQQLQQVLQEY
jgi:hypothetical protein